VAYADRTALVEAIEAARGSRVVSHVIADVETFPPGLPGYSNNLSGEPQMQLLSLLDEIGHVERLDLFLYTRGGTTEAVWPIITALREHCDRLGVLVPFRAHSAGTLLCLGANEVVMLPGAELSPIDPTTGNQFNPPDPANPQGRFGISVEDVVAYFKLAEDLGEIHDEAHRAQVFRELASQVHPLALGNVQRVYMMIRRLARRLLLLHLNEHDTEALDGIVEGLTKEFWSHIHAISLGEARELMGDWVRAPNEDERAAIAALFASYAETLGLGQRFNLPAHMGDEVLAELHVIGGFLETTGSSYAYTTDLKIMQRPQLPEGVQVQVPPGQQIPLAQFVGRVFDNGIRRMGWLENGDGE
jgi:ClpP class serine protease